MSVCLSVFFFSLYGQEVAAAFPMNGRHPISLPELIIVNE